MLFVLREGKSQWTTNLLSFHERGDLFKPGFEVFNKTLNVHFWVYKLWALLWWLRTHLFRVKMKLAEKEKLCFGLDSMRHIWLHGTNLNLSDCQPCWGHAVTSPRSSRKTLTRAEPHSGPWPTPMVTGLWLALPFGFGNSGIFNSHHPLSSHPVASSASLWEWHGRQY